MPPVPTVGRPSGGPGGAGGPVPRDKQRRPDDRR